MSEPGAMTGVGGPTAEEPSLAEHLRAIPYEPLLPVEKKLVAWSIVLGVLLIGVLAWVSHVFFRA